MDSVTQFVLGAALGEAVAGRRAGFRAALAGGLIATLPDLDVFVSMGNAVANFTYHRSASHSLLVLTLVSPLIAWAVNRLQRPERRDYARWLALTWLCLFTHPLLDACTVYGTQLLWPLTEFPFGTGHIFIIDPAYTWPLVAGLLCALFMSRARALGRRLNWLGIGISSAYLMLALGLQAHVAGIVRHEAEVAGLPTAKVAVIPTPFNTVLWRAVVMADDAYHVAYHSLAAPQSPIHFEAYPRTPALLDTLGDDWAVQRLRWFTKGFYGVTTLEDKTVVTDLRMGVEPDSYVFSFVVATRQGNGYRAIGNYQRTPARPDEAFMRALWRKLRYGGAS